MSCSVSLNHSGFNNAYKLKNRLMYLGLNNKKLMCLAREFERSPSHILWENGKFLSRDRRIVIQPSTFSVKYRCGNLVPFFLPLVPRGRRYERRMDNLAMGMIDLIKQAEKSRLSPQVPPKRSVQTFHSTTVEPSPRPSPRPQQNTASRVTQVAKPAYVDTALLNEKQQLARLSSEGTQLLSTHALRIRNLSRNLKDSRDGMSMRDYLVEEGKINALLLALQEIQKSLFHAKEHLQTHAQATRARGELERAISEFKRILPNVSLVSRSVEEAQKNILAKKLNAGQARQPREQVQKPVKVEPVKVEAPKENVEKNPFGEEDPEDLLITALFLGNLHNFCRLDLFLAKLGLRYTGASHASTHTLGAVFKTIGLETLGDCQKKGILNSLAGDKYLEQNRQTLQNSILAAHKDIKK